jgi:phosphatidylglycerol:prolipoprotein diacylglycerol transferase
MLPVLFEIGPVTIYSYGLMLGLSLVLGYAVVVKLATEAGPRALPESVVGNAYVASAITGLLGARLLYVAFNQELLQESGASWYDFTAGGVTAYGGLLGGTLGAAVYMAIKRAPLLEFADAAAPALGLGTLLTRIGCYLYGCDFGTRLSDDAPGWLKAIGTFPKGSPAHHHHNDRYGLLGDVPQSFPVHPTQLYEAAFGVVMLLLALRVYHRRVFAGQAFLLTVGAYGVFRFLIEYIRDDPERGELLGFSSAQLISLLLVPIVAVVYSTLRSKARRVGSSGA